MEMSKVQRCDVTQCAYNRQKACHALAILVGDSDDPCCDTFVQSAGKAGDDASQAGVGACKVAVCEYNNNLECSAGQIVVGFRSDHVDCLTFERRQ
jgi:hypothetical protein